LDSRREDDICKFHENLHISCPQISSGMRILEKIFQVTPKKRQKTTRKITKHDKGMELDQIFTRKVLAAHKANSSSCLVDGKFSTPLIFRGNSLQMRC